jgi:hypothetical protein
MSEENRVSSFKIGPDKEISVDELLMKLASIELLLDAYATYSLNIAKDGFIQEDYNTSPESWAEIGAKQNLSEVSHALKCGCWGYQRAMLH